MAEELPEQPENGDVAPVVVKDQKSEFDVGLIGQRLAGRYLIEEPLGAGGMSVVYKGKHEAIDRAVAIKTLKLDLCAEPILVSRFEREVVSLSKLNHPNIVTVYDCVVTPQGQPYIIMDFIDGESLEAVLKREHTLEPVRAAKIFMQVCQALEHAHRNGVVHRDVKPGNIMLAKGTSGSEQVKVVDFGLAKLMEDSQKLTQTGQLWGSAPYMSPEQCYADEEIPIDHRTDIYSLGAVIYEALIGRDPYHGCDLVQTIEKHRYELPPTFKQVNPDNVVPAAFETVVFTALQKAAENRFQSMTEFREALSYAASPLLKIEQAESAKVLQSKMAERQKRAGKDEKARRSARKAQLSNPFNVFAVVAFTAGVTLFLTLSFALPMLTKFQADHAPVNVPAQTQTVTNQSQPKPGSVPDVTPPRLHEKVEIESNKQVKTSAPKVLHSVALPPHVKRVAKVKVVSSKHVTELASKKPLKQTTKTHAPSSDPWARLENLKQPNHG